MANDAAEAPKRFLLWNSSVQSSDEALFWRPNSMGYTFDLDQAGVYSEAEAKRHERETGREEIAVPLEVARLVARFTVDRSRLRNALADVAKGAKGAPVLPLPVRCAYGSFVGKGRCRLPMHGGATLCEPPTPESEIAWAEVEQQRERLASIFPTHEAVRQQCALAIGAGGRATVTLNARFVLRLVEARDDVDPRRKGVSDGLERAAKWLLDRAAALPAGGARDAVLDLAVRFGLDEAEMLLELVPEIQARNPTRVALPGEERELREAKTRGEVVRSVAAEVDRWEERVRAAIPPDFFLPADAKPQVSTCCGGTVSLRASLDGGLVPSCDLCGYPVPK